MRQIKQFLGLATWAAWFAAGQLMAGTLTPCPSGTLADYIPAFSSPIPVPENQCEVGELKYKQFFFVDMTSGGGQLTEPDFLVSPNLSTGGLDITIPAGVYFDEKYYVSYIVDPAPVLGGEELSMDGFSEIGALSEFSAFAFSISVAPSALASKWACPQGFLTGLPDLSGPVGQDSVGCASLVVSQPIFLQVIPGQTDSATFPEPVFFTQVGILFELNGDLPELRVSTSPQVVPEPGTALLLAGGLAGALALRKRRR